jgi:hypothetical protein
VDAEALSRLRRLGLVSLGGGRLSLTRTGRFLGGGVTAELIKRNPCKTVQLS